jgi:acyl dehydratase
VTQPIQDWETLTVGEEFGPFIYEVSAERVAAYRSVTGDHRVEVVDGEAVAPPTILTFPMLLMAEDKYTPRPGGIHARQVFELLAPVRVGATLTVTGVLTDMRLKRGRKYFTVESIAVDERGTTVARGEAVGLYPSIDIREEAAGD